MTLIFFGLWPVGSTRRLLTADGNGKTFADVLLLLRSCVVNELQPCLLLPHNLLRRSIHHPLVLEDGGKTIRFHQPLNPAFFETKKRRSQDDPHVKYAGATSVGGEFISKLCIHPPSSLHRLTGVLFLGFVSLKFGLC